MEENKSHKNDKYSQYSTKVEIYPHRHCPKCNKMMEPEKSFCSEKCAYVEKRKSGGRKKKMGLFIVGYIVIIALFIIVLT